MTVKKADLKEYLRERINTRTRYEGLLSFPSYLEIETVNVCNARCPMCTIDDWERGGRPMTDELYAKIAREVIAHADQVERVSLYRDGEPLIDMKLANRVAMLKKGGIKNVCISTNVSLLNEARSRDLLTAGLDTIIMSIDSLDKKTFEGIRVRLVFEEVLANALRFIELRNQLRPETKIWMRMIRQESNKEKGGDASSADKKEEARGNASKGKEVFAANCQVCHIADSEEANVGPGLKGLFKKPPHKMADGTEHTRHTVPLIRDQIVQGSSAMPPAGASLSSVELDDLIAYLQTL